LLIKFGVAILEGGIIKAIRINLDLNIQEEKLQVDEDELRKHGSHSLFRGFDYISHSTSCSDTAAVPTWAGSQL
jgi:hypothetical protein